MKKPHMSLRIPLTERTTEAYLADLNDQIAATEDAQQKKYLHQRGLLAKRQLKKINEYNQSVADQAPQA